LIVAAAAAVAVAAAAAVIVGVQLQHLTQPLPAKPANVKVSDYF
jgi:hypothetical protein